MPPPPHPGVGPDPAALSDGTAALGQLLGRNRPLGEAITPAKLAVALLFRDFWKDYRERRSLPIPSNNLNSTGQTDASLDASAMEVTTEDHVDEKDVSHAGKERVCVSLAARSPIHRRRFLCLMIRLTRGVDRSLRSLIQTLLTEDLSVGILSKWAENLAAVAEGDAGHLSDLVKSLADLFRPADMRASPDVDRHSFMGTFLRLIVLAFDRLSANDVNNLLDNVRRYVQGAAQSMNHILALTATSKEALTRDFSLLEECPPSPDQDEAFSKKQAEVYISDQIRRLESDEQTADPPAVIKAKAEKIRKSCAVISSDAYFLDFLNNVRIRDFSSAEDAARLAIDAEACTKRAIASNQFYATRINNNENQVTPEDINKGFRFSSLTLAALHARFQHRKPALDCVRESMTLAQESNDHYTLLYTLMWLLRIDQDTDKNLSLMIEHFYDHAYEFRNEYLEGVAYLNRAQFDVMHGYSPSTATAPLVFVELLAMATANLDLLTASLSQRASMWTLYGQYDISGLVAQLALVVGSVSRPGRGGGGGDREGMALAFCALANKLFDKGHLKASAKVIELAKSVFPHTTSAPGCSLRLCAVKLEFLKAIRSTDWIVAERLIQEVEPLERWGSPDEGGTAGLSLRNGDDQRRLTGHVAFMRLQLHLAKGDSVALREQLARMPDPIPPTPKTEGAADVAVARSPVYCVAKLLFEVEWYCLTKNYHGAVSPLMSCLQICADFHLRKLELSARLHVAHLQLHLKMSADAVRVLRDVLPPLLAQGDAFECGRGHLLRAKCLVAAAAAAAAAKRDGPVEGERRMAMLEALGALKKAAECFERVGDKQRQRDVLYLKARLYNDLDMINERNLVANKFKEHVLMYPTNVSSKLDTML